MDHFEALQKLLDQYKAGLMTANEYEVFVLRETVIFGQPIPKHAQPDEQHDNGKTSWTIA